MVSDGYLDGMQAWITAYHGVSQSSKYLVASVHTYITELFLDLISDPLTLSSGSIWTALNIDYAGHSFSHLGVFFGE